MSVERDSGSVCRELESVCSEREIKRDRERMCMSITIEIESVCEYRERKECVCREKDRWKEGVYREITALLHLC